MAEQLTSLDMIPLVRRGLKSPATGDVPDAAIAQYIWLAECDLAEMYDFPVLRDSETVNTSAGTYDYELTEADILRFLDPANNVTSTIPMRRKDDYWDRKIGSLMTGEGPPFFFYEEGEGSNGRKQIRVRPTPDGIYELEIPFIKTPTMYDTDDAVASDLPQSHMLQVVERSCEVGLALQHERGEAEQQMKISGKTTLSARHALPGAAFYLRRLETFQHRMSRNRGRRARR